MVDAGCYFSTALIVAPRNPSAFILLNIKPTAYDPQPIAKLRVQRRMQDPYAMPRTLILSSVAVSSILARIKEYFML